MQQLQPLYGSSPAMDALGDCLSLQKVTESGRKSLEKEVDPPLLISTSAGIGDVDITPGALNYHSPLAQGQPAVTSLYQVRSNLQSLEGEKAQLKQQIREMFFNDLFLMITQQRQQMTAEEVRERNSEKMLLLGPVLDRLRSELFAPCIVRLVHLEPWPLYTRLAQCCAYLQYPCCCLGKSQGRCRVCRPEPLDH